MANIVLGISGSIAAYRAADLARELMRQGHTVRACLTDAAQKFVSVALFEGLTGQPCLQDVFDEPEAGRMAHIDWARQADLLLIAPASANTIAKLATGVCDDMLTTIAVAFTGPLVIAPAMNPTMYVAETTQANIYSVEGRALFVNPGAGEVACGEYGEGKFAAISEIVEAVSASFARSDKLRGKKVLITAGPTQEPIDNVRYITNHSSGKMGFALARAAVMMGAEVTVVSGPTALKAPFGIKVVPVVTACEMLEEATRRAPSADLVIGAAAVADYRPLHKVDGKIRRTSEDASLKLVANPDIVAALAKIAKGPVIGFAAEPDASLDEASEKLKRKGLAAIAVNDVSRTDIGFDSDSNEIRLIFADGRVLESGRRSKLGCAMWLLDTFFASFPTK